MQHNWIKSTLGHGETMCSRCFITNREAAALGQMNVCETPPPKPANDLSDVHDEDEVDQMICPITSQPCTTEQDEFCEDYGCAHRAGIDVDRDLIA